VSRPRRRAIVLAVLATVALRVGHAAPALATAQVRAVTCCAAHENAAPPVREAERCCQIVSDVGDPTVTGAAPTAPAPVLVGVDLTPLLSTPPTPQPTRLVRLGDRATGPPRYLRLCTLLR
jgi:hypothetical protein